jgi:hypothetical protein
MKPFSILSARFASKCYYSTSTEQDLTEAGRKACFQELQLKSSLSNFYEWLSGFSDGESSFYYRVRSNVVAFEFKISLHKDDLAVLVFIQESLGKGKVDISGGKASFRVVKHHELLFLLEIFDKFPLNSNKYLNYLDFKQAFDLYKIKSPLAIKEIIKLKNGMNTLRTSFTMPLEHRIRITPYWVLGFTEGEGSFSIRKDMPFYLVFSLTQKGNTALMKALEKFFNNLGSSRAWRDKVSPVSTSYDNRIANKGEITGLYINRVDYITSVIIPFFDSFTWHSKKEQDYKDWKSVLELKKLGLHWREDGVSVINLILSRMNLNRSYRNSAKLLSTKNEQLREDIKNLLAGPSNLEIRADGRIFIKSLNKYYKGAGNTKVDLLDENGLIFNSFASISECAKYLDLSASTVRDRLHSNQPICVANKKLFICKSIDNGSIV